VIDSGNVSGIVITSSGGNNQINESGSGDSFTVSLSMLVRQCGDGKQRLYRSLELLQCSMTTRLIHGSNAS